MAAPTGAGRYSRDAMTARLGADVMAHIDTLAAASPDPHPDECAMLRRLFGRALTQSRRARADHTADAA